MSGQVTTEALSGEETHRSEIQQGARHVTSRGNLAIVIIVRMCCHVSHPYKSSGPRSPSCCPVSPGFLAADLLEALRVIFFPVSLLPFSHNPFAFSLLTSGPRGACPGPGRG